METALDAPYSWRAVTITAPDATTLNPETLLQALSLLKKLKKKSWI